MNQLDDATFVHEERAVRVVFGADVFEVLAAEVDRLPGGRVVVVASDRLRARVVSTLGDRVVARSDDPVMHVPVEQVNRTAALVERIDADIAVAVGGGSAVGLAKALALRTGLKVIAVPTTYAGSEMTRVWGQTTDGVKTTGRDEIVAPSTVVYDPALVAGLPHTIALPSAFNALAHAIEALWAPDRSPMTDLFALEAVRVLTEGVRSLKDGAPESPRNLLLGAWLSGMCLDRTTMGLHHKLCHVLGGALGLPHAQTHAAVLPYVMAFNLQALPELRRQLTTYLTTDPAQEVRRLQVEVGCHESLADLGMAVSDVDRVVDLVVAAPYANPRQASPESLRSILGSALRGDSPT